MDEGTNLGSDKGTAIRLMKTLNYFRLVKDTRVMRVKRLTVLVTLAILLAGLVLAGLNDTSISIADTGVPDTKVTSSISKASNSSAGATITITMYAVADE